MSTALAADRDAFREALVRQGLSDDGELLRGAVNWEHPRLGPAAATIEVTIPDAFPFVPPAVRVLDVGVDMALTFHVEYDEGQPPSRLCLWEGTHDVARAPWRDAHALIARVAGHLTRTARGWPGDTDCDLERYLPNSTGLVLYDRERVAALAGRTVRLRHDFAVNVTTVTDDVQARGPRPGGPRRKDRNVAYLDDLGELDAPIRSWADLSARLGDRAGQVSRDIMLGLVPLLVLGYSRSGQRSVLALRVRADRAQIRMHAVESADTSDQTRQLRAGPDLARLAGARVAIVGVGAVGSFTADLLFRAGVRHLTLIDYEVLRPGNVVRHLLGDRYVGWAKVDGVADLLAGLGADTTHVRARRSAIQSTGLAGGIVRSHDLVIDATGDALATGLLSYAASGCADRAPRVLSACVQRQGQVARVDALPARAGEPHLPALQRREGDQLAREQGCGSPVSLTPPGSVVACAELVARLAIDLLAGAGSTVASSTALVFAGQDEEPFIHAGMVTSRAPAPRAPEHVTAAAP